MATEVKAIKVWEQETGDIMRFVVSREQWETLVKALASSCSTNEHCWAGLEVLRTAVEDVDASEMAKCLREVLRFTKKRRNFDEQMANEWAERGLAAANQK